MWIQRIRRCPHEIRCPVLPGGHPLHYLRPRGGIPVPVGGGVRQIRGHRLLVDGGFLGCADRRLCLRMEERRARRGLSPIATPPGVAAAVAPAATGIPHPATGRPVGAKAPYFLRGNHALSDKGLFVTAPHALITWAR